MENKFDSMSFKEVWEFVLSDKVSELSDTEQMQLEDVITSYGSHVGRMLDKVKGIDPYAGKSTRYGTQNHKGYTYKVRKALGYSYP